MSANSAAIAVIACLLALFPGGRAAAAEPGVDPAAAGTLSVRDFQAFPSPPADHRIEYGAAVSQFGELWVPEGPGPHPVVVLIHGGCWKQAYAKSQELSPLAHALKLDGIAAWNIEYRRLPEAGSGWPGTYRDVAAAIDRLRDLAPKYHLDLERVIVLGHSAGGHLAMWAAARGRLPRTSELHVERPLPLRGVMNLAGTIEMARNIENMEKRCGDSVVTQMMGGDATSRAERYEQASTSTFLPLRVAQVLVWGEFEDNVPGHLAATYVAKATAAGDDARLITLPKVGHFETASPHTSTWPTVRDAIRALLAGDRAAK